MSQANPQRVIFVKKVDGFKLHEPSRQSPLWVVPTNKRVRKASQPRQNDRGWSSSAQFYADGNNFAQASEKLNQSQA